MKNSLWRRLVYFFRKKRGTAPAAPYKSTLVIWTSAKQIVHYYLRSLLYSSQWILGQCCRVLGSECRVHLSLSRQQTMVSVHNKIFRSGVSYLSSAQDRYKFVVQVEKTKNPLVPLFLWVWISSSSTPLQGNWMDTQGFWWHRRDFLTRCFGSRPVSSQMNMRGLEKNN